MESKKENGVGGRNRSKSEYHPAAKKKVNGTKKPKKKTSIAVIDETKAPLKRTTAMAKVDPTKEVLIHVEKYDRISASEEDLLKRYSDDIKLDTEIWRKKRDKIAFEIFTSETTYVKSLELCLLIFETAIKESECDLQSLQPLMELFEKMKMIWDFNITLWHSLKQKFKKWNYWITVGDVIYTLAPFLRMYQIYTKLYDGAIACEKKAVSKDPELANILEKATTHPLIKGNSLDSLLILPVQRVPRYVLLLEDLMQNTTSEHPDYPWLQKSLACMKAVATDINDSILHEERRMKCVEISKLFVFSNDIKWSAAHRYLLLQGTVTKQCHNKKEDRELFLFNDSLLYGRALINQHYNILGLLDLDKVLVESIDNSADMDIVNAFIIKSPKKSFYCYAKSATDKAKWIQEITAATSKRRTVISSRLSYHGDTQSLPPISTAAVWDADNTATACTLCGKQFTFAHRRHHCRKCGRLVDADCSPHKRQIMGITDKAVRVCIKCFVEDME